MTKIKKFISYASLGLPEPEKSAPPSLPPQSAPSPSPSPSSSSSAVPRQALNTIKAFEGCHTIKDDGRVYAYPDPLSGDLPITIGWGTTRKKNGDAFVMGNSISQAEADSLLEWQVENDYMSVLAETVPSWVELNDNQKSALISFAYNLGARFFGSDGFDTISRFLRTKQWDKIPEGLMLYTNPGTNVHEGLKRRRAAEGELWKEGLFS